ncbi:MAG TPA: metallophosphoesterase [Terracidiphilus sp.]|nr:metallophosphoesterase [Terracidiphilus sp.]
MKAWPLLGVSVVQGIIFLAHWLLYSTCIYFAPVLSATARADLRMGLLIAAFSFVPAALLSFRYANPLLSFFYRAAVIWLGFAHFLFLAAIAAWPVWLMVRLSGADSPAVRMGIGGLFAAAALAAGVWGLVNARWTRVRRFSVRLPNLPEAWRGRRAVLLSDLHLGNVNGERFSRRMARLAAEIGPDIVFLPGDLFDGVKGDLDRLLAPLRALRPPLGIYFASGNHEEFGDPARYLEPIARAGIRILANERVTVDGMHIAGVSYRDSVHPLRLRALLEQMHLNNGYPSILLHHVPSRLRIVEQAGVALQLSGHTHGGQLFPYDWIARSIFREFTHGLNRFGALQVYTSCGAGTWGPPMRVGTYPEIVALEFE